MSYLGTLLGRAIDWHRLNVMLRGMLEQIFYRLMHFASLGTVLCSFRCYRVPRWFTRTLCAFLVLTQHVIYFHTRRLFSIIECESFTCAAGTRLWVRCFTLLY